MREKGEGKEGVKGKGRGGKGEGKEKGREGPPQEPVPPLAPQLWHPGAATVDS